ncbi:hypothetical protein [Streptomyces sp. BA2]|uniref:hypothetical protein n=1 Tax=Streptomyces sp. BA2 TaxID=436595 RepID=UPI00132121ED|nr:hypothetical protein [Streptomyces sp. BA2]MWA07752.1 hypothetical protein [Streptomyces sp. BA2]
MDTVKITSLVSGFGDIAMAGWTAMVPGQGVRSYALLAHCGPRESGSIMPRVATALGLDPTPGSLTRRLRGKTHFRLSEDGWVTLSMPGGECMEYLASEQWRAACRRERYACLYISYLGFRSDASVEGHLQDMVQSGRFTLGLVRLRSPVQGR